MANQDLPPELSALERELLERSQSEPEPGLRPRVLNAVRRQLRPRDRLSAWQFALATAAAALLWINLSMSVANNLSGPTAGEVDGPRLEETVRRLRVSVPELPETEVYRQALLAQAGARRFAAPVPTLSPEFLLKRKEQQEWASH
jgi:hypothetical protein